MTNSPNQIEKVGSEKKYKERLFIDATPDGNYALRILRAYRAECNVEWTDNTAGLKLTNPFLKTLNDLQKERAKELDLAIKKLL